MKILLQGGGSYPDVKKMDELFFNMINKDKKILYIPIAIVGFYTYSECYNYIESIKKDLGKSNVIEMATDLKNLPENLYEEYDGIYIGGGNTFKLLNDINLSNFREKMSNFLLAGGVICGGSAGAIILGNDINTSADSNIVNLKNTNGLNLIKNYSIYCHYQDKCLEEVKTYVKYHNKPVIALKNNSGIYYNGSSIEIIGNDDIVLFELNQAPKKIQNGLFI